MHARIISERDFQTIHLKILIPNRALMRNQNLISLMSLFLEIWAGECTGACTINRPLITMHD
eukprot:COSAG05_NODE_894_length_6706_cov_13.114424_5_plen_62_part_00